MNKLRGKMVLLAGMMVFCLGLVGAPASWANSLTFQGVTFNLSITGGGSTLSLAISSATGVTGDWVGVNGFAAFQVKDIGTASGLALSNWTNFDQSLSANGCASGSGGGNCFARNAGPVAFVSNAGFTLPTFTITKTSGTFDLTSPHLKVLFTTNGQTTFGVDNHGNPAAFISNKTGSLLSQTIPGSVPVPGTALMFGVGLALFLGWHYRSLYRIDPVGVTA